MIADQLCDLDKVVPMTSEAEVLHEEVNRALRERVLKLLAEDEGIVNPDIPDLSSKRMTMEEYKIKKHNLGEQLMEALEATDRKACRGSKLCYGNETSRAEVSMEMQL